MVRDTYPDGIATLSEDKPPGQMFHHEIIPKAVDDISSWIHFVTKFCAADHRRPVDVMYTEPIPGLDQAVLFTGRVQGILGKANIGALGNWTG